MNKILKKFTAVFTSAVLLTSGLAMGTTAAFAAEDEDTYLAAGSVGAIFGTAWDPVNHTNDMTQNADGTWSKTYTVDQAYTAVQVKTVKNEAVWIGDQTNNNVTFNLTGPGTFTVVYDPDPTYNDGDGITRVEGDIVEIDDSFNYTTVYAVGNGEGTYLNGASWDPAAAANEMTEISDDVWQISFDMVPAGFERQIKFATDGTWTHSFGAPDFEEGDDMNNHIGEWMDAKYNSSNITFDTDDICNITATIDLRSFDNTTKTGALFKLDIEYIECLVAGTPAEIFGTVWDGTNTDNLMDYDDTTGTWSIEYTVDSAYNVVQLKTVKNGAEWIGDDTDENVTFALTGPGTFTVTYDPDETFNGGKGVTTVSGAIVEPITGFDYSTVFAVGNGEGTWLNDQAWAPGAPGNEMTEIEADVWQITFTDVPDGFDRQIKFAIDGDWTHNFGFNDLIGQDFEPGVWMPAKYNGQNITFDTDDICDITATLDLSNFDFETKQGAVYKIDIEYDTVIGDVDGDGELTISDATLLQRYLSEFVDDTALDLTVADVNGDGKVNIKDVTEIQRTLAGLV